jgi:hypothetical protein
LPDPVPPNRIVAELPPPARLVIEAYTEPNCSGAATSRWNALFNPAEYALTRTNAFNQTAAAGASRPRTSYSHGTPDSLSLSLFFDGTGVMGTAGPVSDAVTSFLDLMKFQGGTHQPYYLRVSWGTFTLTCVLKTATATFTLFDRDGRPIRAKVAATFEEITDEVVRRHREDRASPDLVRAIRVEEGETLDGLAFREYGDTRYWRAIARANRLTNPRALRPGQVLLLYPKAV